MPTPYRKQTPCPCPRSGYFTKMIEMKSTARLSKNPKVIEKIPLTIGWMPSRGYICATTYDNSPCAAVQILQEHSYCAPGALLGGWYYSGTYFSADKNCRRRCSRFTVMVADSRFIGYDGKKKGAGLNTPCIMD
jgi:hypothetical protein